MSVNNRQRRAPKQRKRAGERRRRTSGPGSAGGHAFWDPPYDASHPDRVDLEELRWRAAQRLRMALVAVEAVPRSARRRAEELITTGSHDECELVRDVAATVLENITRDLVAQGWTPADLGQITRRRLAPRHASLLAALLVAEADRHPDHLVQPAWRDELAELGLSQPLDLVTVEGMQLALEIGALLTTLPAIAQVMPPPGTAGGSSATRSSAHRQQLIRVRALLAKAESTEFVEEAEALSAKAQELISRYALEHLLVHTTCARRTTVSRHAGCGSTLRTWCRRQC